MPQYTFNPNDVHIQAALRNLSVSYRNNTLIWDSIAPIVPVTKRSDKFFVFDEAEAFTVDDDRVSPNAAPRNILQRFSESNYSVTDRALSAYVPVEAIRNADDILRPLGRAVEGIRSRLLLAHEKRVADVMFSAATYQTGYKVTLSSGDQWSHEDSNPINDILLAMDVPLQMPNTLVLGRDTWRILRQHPQVIASVNPIGGNAGSGGVVSLEALQAVLGIRIVVGMARYNSANPGQANSVGNIWGKHAALIYTEPNPSNDTPTFAVTFSESLTDVYREFEGKIGANGSEFVRESWNEDVKVISPKSGYFWENAVA